VVNSTLELTEIRSGDMGSIHVAEDKDKWRVLVKAMMNLRVP
jgi:hypothetical protein